MHLEQNAYLTESLVSGKPYDQVFEETVADFLHETAQPGESVRDQLLKLDAFLNSLQSRNFTYVPRGVSQAAAYHGQASRVNSDSPGTGTQAYTLPLFGE